jgi:hypothetical protein
MRYSGVYRQEANAKNGPGKTYDHKKPNGSSTNGGFAKGTHLTSN